MTQQMHLCQEKIVGQSTSTLTDEIDSACLFRNSAIARTVRGNKTGKQEVGLASRSSDGYWLAGEYDKGRQTAEELLRLAERSGARYDMGYAHLLLSEMLLETDPAQVATLFEKSIAVFQEIKAENALAMTYAGFGRLHKQQGNVEMAREYLAKTLEILERLGTLIEPDKVRKELAELLE
jgi:tetratricopeptide (TPR) repeat protein